MFEQMLSARGFSRRPPEFLSTHPLDENRIADSRNRANTYPRIDYIQNPEYLLMRERVLVHYATDMTAEIDRRERALPQLNGMEEDATRYGIALAQLKAGRFVQATESLGELLQKEPSRISYAMLEAEIARSAGDYQRALETLERNLRINPGNHPLTMTYATTLTKAGRYTEAAAVLEKHAVNHPNDMQLWYDLAEVQGQAGNIGKVHQARAEYFITVGDFARARDQLNFALAMERDPLVTARLRQRLDYIRDIQNRFYR